MANHNRIKVVLVEQQKTGKWLANKWKNPLAQSANGVAMFLNHLWRHLSRLQNSLKSILMNSFASNVNHSEFEIR